MKNIIFKMVLPNKLKYVSQNLEINKCVRFPVHSQLQRTRKKREDLQFILNQEHSAGIASAASKISNSERHEE
jgi:hypothetical protein